MNNDSPRADSPEYDDDDDLEITQQIISRIRENYFSMTIYPGDQFQIMDMEDVQAAGIVLPEEGTIDGRPSVPPV